MVKYATSSRAFRAQARELFKVRKELSQKTREAISTRKKMADLGTKCNRRYRVILEENNILRKSLKNFQLPFYKLKRENHHLRRGIRAIRNATAKSRAQKRRNLKTLHPVSTKVQNVL